jgi:hypothetical protein
MICRCPASPHFFWLTATLLIALWFLPNRSYAANGTWIDITTGWLRHILGDETVEMILVPRTTDGETMARIHRLFPGTLVAKTTTKGVIIDGAPLKRD